MFFGDLIAIMRDGRIEQVGTPEEIFLNPRTRFVAAFMGQTDFVQGKVNGGGIETPLGRLGRTTNLPTGTLLEVALRPIDVALSINGQHNGWIQSRQFLGIATIYRIALANGVIVHSWQSQRVNLPPGESVQVKIRQENTPPVFFNGLALSLIT